MRPGAARSTPRRVSVFGESVEPHARLVPVTVEAAVSYGLIEHSDVKLVLGSMLAVYETALQRGDYAVAAAAELDIEIESRLEADGSKVCEDCGGVVPWRLNESGEIVEDRGNPWHDPETGRFGKPNRAIWSLHFKGSDQKRKAVSSAKGNAKSAKPIRGQPCGCSQLNASGKGCKIKHKDACHDLQWGAKGAKLKAAVVSKRTAAEKAKFSDYKKRMASAKKAA